MSRLGTSNLMNSISQLQNLTDCFTTFARRVPRCQNCLQSALRRVVFGIASEVMSNLEKKRLVFYVYSVLGGEGDSPFYLCCSLSIQVSD
jgi:hypothetical protein